MRHVMRQLSKIITVSDDVDSHKIKVVATENQDGFLITCDLPLVDSGMHEQYTSADFADREPSWDKARVKLNMVANTIAKEIRGDMNANVKVSRAKAGHEGVISWEDAEEAERQAWIKRGS